MSYLVTFVLLSIAALFASRKDDGTLDYRFYLPCIVSAALALAVHAAVVHWTRV